MINGRAFCLALLISSAGCGSAWRLEPLPPVLSSRDAAADAAAAFAAGDQRFLAYQTGLGALVPGIARDRAERLHARGALRLVRSDGDVIRSRSAKPALAPVEFAAFGEYLLAYNTAMDCLGARER